MFLSNFGHFLPSVFSTSVILLLVIFYLHSFYVRSFYLRSFYVRSFYTRSQFRTKWSYYRIVLFTKLYELVGTKKYVIQNGMNTCYKAVRYKAYMIHNCTVLGIVPKSLWKAFCYFISLGKDNTVQYVEHELA